MLLSDKYWDYIDEPARAEFLEGTTAAGKTTTVGIKFIMNVEESPLTLHVIASKTTGVAEKNIINSDFGLKQIFPNLQYYGNGDKNNKLPHLKLGNKIIYILGYDNKDKWENALGSQFGCVWVDECNTADMDFIREIFGRSKYFVGTLNPDDPSLPVYDEYVNKARPIDKYKKDVPTEIMGSLNKCEPVPNWKYWFFSFEDNISMTKEDIEEKKLSYPKGTKIYKNKVQGLRGRATGLIFPNFNQEKNVISKTKLLKWMKDEKNPLKFECFTVGVDTSYSQDSPDTFAFIFEGITKCGKCIVLDEEVYNNRDLQIPLAPSDIVPRLISFLERNRKEWGFARDVFIDNADQATITECLKYKRTHPCLYNFLNAYKKIVIIDRIHLQLGWINCNDAVFYYVLDHCKHHIQEHEVYSWKDDKYEPEDKNDHTINAAQYGWIPFKTKIGVINK
jgi:PBSX family phage terminase large subunit